MLEPLYQVFVVYCHVTSKDSTIEENIHDRGIE
jgi:hypothetical protein